MSAVQTTAQPRPSVDPRSHLTFGRVLRSEWLKFITIRSTVWVVVTTIVVMVGFSMLMAVGMTSMADAGADPETSGMPGAGSEIGVFVATLGYSLGQIVVAVLGVLIISGEYSTGQIRSTLAAVPTRLPVLWAKALIVAVTAFVLGAVGVLLSVLATTPMLEPHGMAADLSDPAAREMVLGVPLYLTGIALLALAIGTLLRHSAGGIATVLGVLLVLPILGQIQLDWVQDIAPYLPSAAGERIIMGEMEGATLTPWQGLGVLGAYVVVTMAAAAVLLRRRDA